MANFKSFLNMFMLHFFYYNNMKNFTNKSYLKLEYKNFQENSLANTKI